MEAAVDLVDRLLLNPERVINIVFVGHVDAGKSTIAGRILVDLCKVDPRTLDKFKQQSSEMNRSSWYLSWCMDLNPEEREHGRTIEAGRASFSLPHTRVNVLDAPGHKQFVQEMIDASARADLGVLIVSARAGEFEAGFSGGQTKEHLLLLKLGGVDRLAVLINKMDEAGWSQPRYDEIIKKLEKHTRRLFQFITFIPVSGQDGSNIKEKFACPFYSGPSFLEWLDSLEVKERAGRGCMTVVEKIRTSGATYLSCKVDSGTFGREEEAELLPLCLTDRIVAIATEAEVDTSAATAGDTFRVRLKSHGDEVSVGHKILLPGNDEYSAGTEIYAQLGILDAPKAVTVGFTAVIHLALQTVGCKIVELYSMEKKRVRIAREGDRVIARLVLESPVVVGCTEARRDRFALRHESVTVASGVVRKVIR